MSLSMPNTWRIDTFMSGSPATGSVAIVIRPPCLGTPEAHAVRARIGCHRKLTSRTRRVGKPIGRSAITHRFQIVVRLDDLAQAVLARSVATIGVGMVAFHQDLELGFDVGRAGVGFKAQRVEGL